MVCGSEAVMRTCSSVMGEASYSFQKERGWLRGVTLKGAAAMDAGGILGNNYGIQLTIIKTGVL